MEPYFDRIKTIEKQGPKIKKNIEALNALSKQLEALQQFTFQAVDQIVNEIKNLSRNEAHDETMLAGNLYFSGNNNLETRLTKIEKDIKTYIFSNDKQAIKFGGLGFRSVTEAGVWYNDHCKVPQGIGELPQANAFGLLPDFHIVMAFLKRGTSLAKTIKDAKKLDFDRLAQNIAIESFDAKIPDFFTSDMSNTIIGDRQSYFTSIPSFSDWSAPFTGKKARLRSQLNDFRKYYKALLESGLFIQLSPFYNVCYLAMNESISFIEGLIKFMDETFEQYKRTKYGEDKAWHVVT